LVTDNVQIFLSLAIIGVVLGEVCYCGYQIHLGRTLIEYNQGKAKVALILLDFFVEIFPQERGQLTSWY
jgi:TRAP-type uncharacterized transport system fused permease subunit